MEIKGGCLCGAVRYTAEADPTSATVCHCRDCQKFTGSAFAALVRVTREALTIEGCEPRRKRMSLFHSGSRMLHTTQTYFVVLATQVASSI